MQHSLSNLRVLITRPLAQSRTLAAKIQEYQGIAVQVPTLEIVGVPASPSLRQKLSCGTECHLVVFVSRNAVVHANAITPLADLAMHSVIAPGRATAQALNDVGVNDVITPASGNDSESLLALPEMCGVSGKHILIVRGRGGREELHDKLLDRGARVNYVEVYDRRQPADCHENLCRALAVGVDVICVSSGEAMENLLSSLPSGKAETVLQLPLFAPSPRVAGLARARGFKQPVIADTPDDLGTTTSLLQWATAQRPV
jgi:uroporphyrinogen-III synthase